MTIVRVPTPLRPYTGGAKEVEASGETVGAVLGDLAQRFPDLKRHLFDDAGGLRPYVNVFLNDDDVRTLQGEATQLKPGDRLMIIPSIAGGAPIVHRRAERPGFERSARIRMGSAPPRPA
jgi:molybdopterin converting factor small subunit